MIGGPIRFVLQVLQECEVRCLLMGGQACVLYGAAEFSKDIDLAILSDDANLVRFQTALLRLEADVIAVPPFKRHFLEEGLAVHFRCRHPEAAGLRIDVMAKMRGMKPFAQLWRHRTTVELDDELSVDVLALPDLVGIYS